MTASMTLLLAHQSDWLSMALVCIPLVAFGLILSLANKRALRDGPVDMRPPPGSSHHSGDAA